MSGHNDIYSQAKSVGGGVLRRLCGEIWRCSTPTDLGLEISQDFHFTMRKCDRNATISTAVLSSK